MVPRSNQIIPSPKTSRIGVDETLRAVFLHAVERLGTSLVDSRVIVVSQPWENKTSSRGSPMVHEWSKNNTPSKISDLELSRLIRQVSRQARAQTGVLQLSQISKANDESQPLLACTIRNYGQPLADLIAIREHGALWQEAEVAEFFAQAQQLSEECHQALAPLRSPASSATTAIKPSLTEENRGATLTQKNLSPLLSGSQQWLQFFTDRNYCFTKVSDSAQFFFGVSSAALQGISIFEFVPLTTRETLRDSVEQCIVRGETYRSETALVNHVSGEVLPVQFVLGACPPQNQALSGFVCVQEENAEASLVQLREVANAVRALSDPHSILARGVIALAEALGLDAALCYGTAAEDFELISHYGLPRQAVKRLKSPLPASYRPQLSGDIRCIVAQEMLENDELWGDVVRAEGFVAAIVVPVRIESSVLGEFVFFNKERVELSERQKLFIDTAVLQLGLAVRQGMFLVAYRKQTKNLTALYRLSHELSGSMSLDEISQTSFAIIREELGVKRLWLGLINETGTRVIGQAAYGPGWRRRLVEINVEVAGREHPIARVVASRAALVITDPEQVLQEFGSKRFFSRFSVKAVGLIPLISAGQMLGVLAFQPSEEETLIEPEEMTLMSSLAAEIAATILSKRLDERSKEGEKMRTASLLAAGIAHNFNNLLQAIMGQASLLEIQSLPKEQILKAAQSISDSASRGATLVRQLVSVANLEEPVTESTDVNAILERGLNTLSRHLKAGQKISLKLSEELPHAAVDPNQLLRVLSNLISNASEASGEGQAIEISTDSCVIDQQHPHHDVPDGEYLRVVVRDWGVGMSEELKSRCFEPFFTTKNVDPGSGLSMSGAGLGLAAAFALVRKNGGRLLVESKLGMGSVFTVYLPVNVETSLAQDIEIEKQSPTKQEEGVVLAGEKVKSTRAKPQWKSDLK